MSASARTGRDERARSHEHRPAQPTPSACADALTTGTRKPALPNSWANGSGCNGRVTCRRRAGVLLGAECGACRAAHLTGERCRPRRGQGAVSASAFTSRWALPKRGRVAGWRACLWGTERRARRVAHLTGEAPNSWASVSSCDGKGDVPSAGGRPLEDGARGAPCCPSHGRAVMALARAGRGERGRPREDGRRLPCTAGATGLRGRPGDRDAQACAVQLMGQ